MRLNTNAAREAANNMRQVTTGAGPDISGRYAAHAPREMKMSLLEDITEIIDKIPAGCYFDSHYIIEMLHQKHPKDYAIKVSGMSNNESLNLVHSELSKKIRKIPFVERIPNAKSYSLNLHHNANKCALWRKHRSNNGRRSA